MLRRTPKKHHDSQLIYGGRLSGDAMAGCDVSRVSRQAHRVSARAKKAWARYLR